GPQRRCLRHTVCELLEDVRPLAAGPADDLVTRALAADIFVSGNSRKNGNAGRVCERPRLAGAIVLIDHEASDADIAAELAEIFDCRANVIGDVERLQIVGADDDDLLA